MSSTVSTKCLMLSQMIDAMEGRDIENYDIPGAFLQTDYENSDIHTNMEEEMVTII